MSRKSKWEILREQARKERLASEDNQKIIARHREWFFDNYHSRKEHGICVRCGKQDAIPNRVMCQDCMDKRSVKKQDFNKSQSIAIKKHIPDHIKMLIPAICRHYNCQFLKRSHPYDFIMFIGQDDNPDYACQAYFEIMAQMKHAAMKHGIARDAKKSFYLGFISGVKSKLGKTQVEHQVFSTSGKTHFDIRIRKNIKFQPAYDAGKRLGLYLNLI